MSATTTTIRRGTTTTAAILTVAAAHVTVVALAGWWRLRRRGRGRQQPSPTDDDDDDADGPEAAYLAFRASVPPRSIVEFEEAAMRTLPPLSRTYFQYYSDQAVTAGACRTFYNSIRLLPTILTGDVSEVDTRLEIFGETLDLPVLVAPTAFHTLACVEGEVATARGAGAGGAGYCYNWMLSSRLYSDVLHEDGVKWLHLYIFEERGLVEAAIERALASGGFSAIILSCDHPHQRVQGRMLPYFMRGTFPYSNLDDPFFPNQAVLGYDAVTLRQLTDPEAMAAMIGGSPGGTNSFKLSWDDVKWVDSLVNGRTTTADSSRNKRRIPIVAKGILSAGDARIAVESGVVDAIVVSNHGGRQCDVAVSAIEALPAVVAAVAGRIPVFVDSGVRTSGDIVRAMCLGATGVLLGRPPLWALATGGSDGLQRMLETLKADLKDDMRSLGVTSLSQLGMDLVWPPDRERIQDIVKVCGE